MGDQAVRFDAVKRAEQDAIQIRRRALEVSSPEASPTQSVLPIEGAVPPADRGNEELKDLFGVAFSGGGIRSACFNLGVLQAMAEQRLLTAIDYLSTVSGGGYIGAWLAAMTRRYGRIDLVEKKLAANVFDKPEEVSYGKSDARDEMQPIQHLRANSNYLAPQPGLFSLDSWILIASYLRNIILNLSVTVPTAIAMIFGVLFIVSLFISSNELANPASLHWLNALGPSGAILSVGVALILALEMRAARNFCDTGASSDLHISKRKEILFITAVPLLALDLSRACSVLLGSLGLAERSIPFAYVGKSQFLRGIAELLNGWHSTLNYVGSAGFITAGASLHVLLFHWKSIFSLFKGDQVKNNLTRVFSGLVAGSSFAWLLLTIRKFAVKVQDNDVFSFGGDAGTGQALLIVPLVVLAMVVSQSLQSGIVGLLEHRLIRERWASWHASCLRFAVFWILLLLHTVILPPVVLELISQDVKSAIAPAVAWLITTSCSIYLAQSKSTGKADSNSGQLMNLIARAAPVLFLSGVMLSLATVVHFFLKLGPDTVPTSILKSWVMAPPAAGAWWIDSGLGSLFSASIMCLLIATLAGRFLADVNLFSLHEIYQNRLVRCYLGAARSAEEKSAQNEEMKLKRLADPLTNFDPKDDFDLKDLKITESRGQDSKSPIFLGPLHIFNVAINLCQSNDLAKQERRADSFVMTPYYCGAAITGYRPTEPEEKQGNGYGGGLKIGEAVATSGAAVSPNMGYFSSPAVTALLTLFNLRLGTWKGNPNNAECWTKSTPTFGWMHIIREMMGKCDVKSEYIYLSDGGHFDNLGAYELIRRRCKYIVICDAGMDSTGACNELAMLQRKVRVDFGVEIDIDVTCLRPDATGFVKRPFVVGTISYPRVDENEEMKPCYLYYLKMTMEGNESQDLLSYRSTHPKFPNESTVNQFYSESQFESYRRLGYEKAKRLFHGSADHMDDKHPLREYLTDKSPKELRDRTKLGRYFQALLANAEANPCADWESRAIQYDIRYAELTRQAFADRNLAKLAAELAQIDHCLHRASERILNQSSETAAKKDQKDEPVTLRDEDAKLQSLWEVGRDSEESRAESGWNIQAVTLLFQVFGDLNLKTYHELNCREWTRVMRMWVATSVFDRDWKRLEPDFPVSFRKFLNEMREDANWIKLEPKNRSSGSAIQESKNKSPT